MSYAAWFFRAVGYLALLQFLIGAGLLIWAIFQVIRAPQIRLLGVHGAALLLPLLIGLIFGAIGCVDLFQLNRLIDQPLTPLEMLPAVLHTVGQQFCNALIVTTPSALVVTIGWLVQIRRQVK